MKQLASMIVLTGLWTACAVGQIVTVTEQAAVSENGYLYLDPEPESEYVARETGLLIRFAWNWPADLTNLPDFIQVIGQKSGLHAGATTVATDDKTVVFVPSDPFVANEAVDVTLSPRFDPSAGEPAQPIQYRFYVLRPADAPLESVDTPEAVIVQTQTLTESSSGGTVPSGHAAIMYNGVSVPSDFPHVYVTTGGHPADGYIFVEYNQDTSYTLIMDNLGAPVWYRRGSRVEDLKVQKNGMITHTQYVGYDQDFNWVKEFHAVNGCHTDDHELQVQEDGGYLLLGQRLFNNVDMSRIVDGGNPNATVRETCIQEFTAADELIFQWRAWDHFDIADVGPASVEDVRAASIRFPHMNAIDIDDDGHILLSSRHLHEITKINRQTGAIIWRLGGPHSDFTFVNDPLGGFSCQHDIRALGHRRYTLFDNGTTHDPPVSRAVEYELDLDPNKMTATLVWEYRADPGRYTYNQGNAQRLPNGNTLINFAQSDYPVVTEVNAAGEIEFEMEFASGPTYPYRVFRFPWTGVVEKPYLVVEPNFDKVTLLFNKFGDPNVAYYRVYGGLDPNPNTVMATSDTTLLDLYSLKNDHQYYFRVTAVDRDGTESAFSNEESILAYLYDPRKPSGNLVDNADFSQGQTDWTLKVSEPAAAEWGVEDGRAHVAISAGGDMISTIRLIQPGMKLVHGETYVLEFDAGARSPRLIEVKLNKKNVGYYWNYSKMGPVYVPTTRQGLVMTHFTHTFLMDAETDLDGCLEINVGSSDTDVYLDNVSLVRQAHSF